MTVGIYVRISDDVAQTGLGVERQERDCRLIAETREWQALKVYVDNDISAFKRKVVRPQFEQLLADLQAGLLSGVVVYDLDRFVRQPRDLERAIEIYEDRPDLAFASVQGDINLGTPDGKTMARVLVAFANKASMDTARRVARKHLENARNGKPVGGYRPFGWQADKSTLHPVEAPLGREAIEQFLAGTSVRSILKIWRERGVTTTTGGPWKPATFRQWIKNPRLCGHRVHQGATLLDEAGDPVIGKWDPLATPEEHARVLALFDKPDVRTRKPVRGNKIYMLSGLLTCQECLGRMYGNKVGDRHYYSCHGNQDGHSVSVSGQGADAFISHLVAEMIARTGRVSTRGSEWPKKAELANVERQIADLMDGLSRGVSGDLVWPRLTPLDERRRALRAEREVWTVTEMQQTPRAVTPEEFAGDPDVDRRRAVVEFYIETILVRRATRRGNRFDETRLDPIPSDRAGGQAVPSRPGLTEP